MFQIDNSSTVAQMPSPSAAGTPGFFTDGNPATGQAATILPAEFMNMLMMELMSVIQAGNVTPDKTKTNQVLTSLQALFLSQSQGDTRYALQSAFANSKAASGYQKLQGGLIIQWGTAAVNSTSGTPITFPIAFPNSTAPLIAAVDGGNGCYTYGFASPNGSGATVFARNPAASGALVTGVTCTYIAIGY